MDRKLGGEGSAAALGGLAYVAAQLSHNVYYVN